MMYRITFILLCWVALGVVAVGCGGKGGSHTDSGDAELSTEELPVELDDPDTVEVEPEREAVPEQDLELDPTETAEPDIPDNEPAEEDGDSFEPGHGIVPLDFALDLAGQGSNRLGAVDFTASVGTVALGQSLPALAYQETVWDDYDYILYHVLVPTADDLNVIYFYCTHAGGVPYAYHESFAQPMAWETMTGACTAQATALQAEAALRPLNALPMPDPYALQFTITGTQLTLAGDTRQLMLGERSFTIHPFEVVDCTKDCSADPADGWWELHSILSDETTGEPCFGILYLLLKRTDQVNLGYGFCLHRLTRLPESWLTAAWTAPTTKGAGRTLAPQGPRVVDGQGTSFILRPGPRP